MINWFQKVRDEKNKMPWELIFTCKVDGCVSPRICKSTRGNIFRFSEDGQCEQHPLIKLENYDG